MQTKYDVIIIGAGPAGLKCAEELKDSELSVLLVEKNNTIGPKICAGALTGLVSDSDIPESKARSFAKQSIFLNEIEYPINLVLPLKTVDRHDLGQHQLGKIEKSSNITITKETYVKSISSDSIITNNGTFNYKYLVGADGSTSGVRKHLGLRSEKNIAIYYNIQEVTEDFIWYFYPNVLKSGYIWIFPHKQYTNAGIHYNPRYLNRKRAEGFLSVYLKSKGLNFSKSDYKGASINHLYEGCVFDNIFLAGDAAGLASKLTGEGISYALTSGSEIGKKILNPDYKMPAFEKILAIKKRQDKLSKIYDKFDSSAGMQNLFCKIGANLLKHRRVQSYFGNKRLAN